MVEISGKTLIEDLIGTYPQAVGVLIELGLPCVVCGEPFWGTLADLARQKDFDEAAIAGLVSTLRSRLV